MKKSLLSLFVLAFAATLHADELPITFGELPKSAKVFILNYFKDVPIRATYIERRASLTQYEVELDGDVELQFDRTGLCTEVTCKQGAVPDAIIPEKIRGVVKKHFPACRIVKYEHNGRMYDIELSDDTSLTFSNSFRLVDVDLGDKRR